MRRQSAPIDLRTAQDLIDEENRRDSLQQLSGSTSRIDRRNAEAEKLRLRTVIAALRALGLEPPTTLEAATREWRRQLLLVHPDVRGDHGNVGGQTAEERTRVLNEAYAIVKEHYNG